jgi:antitoxin ParD1/3/4
MNILLTPEQAEIIQQKLQSGHQNVNDAIDRAIQLLDEWDENTLAEDADWIASTQQKVDLAIDSLGANGVTDGTIVVNWLLDKFRQARQSS